MGRNQALLFSILILFSLHPSDFLTDEVNTDFFTDANETPDPPLIGFDQDIGLSFDSNMAISGFIVSSTIPDSSILQIFRLYPDGSSTNASESITLNLSSSVSNQDDGLSRWTWEFSMDTSSISNCTCLVTVTSTANGLPSTKSTVFFTGVTNVPALVLHDPSRDDQNHIHSQKIDIFGWSGTQDNQPVDIISIAINSENSASTCSIIPVATTLGEQSGNNEEASNEFSSIGHFAESIDVSMLIDGWYSLWLVSTTNDNSSIIQPLCLTLKIDNSSPVAILEGNTIATEGDGNLIFDAGSSYDHYWGKQNLNYVWTLIMKEASGNSIINILEGSEFSYYTVEDDVSGNFELSLLVVDQQGKTNSTSVEFSIENQPPVAKLVVSEQSLSDGDNFQLPDSSEWILDATQSIDTSNDIDALRCVWKINFKTIYEGCQRKLLWPEGDNNDTLLLTLEVIDDDDDFSSITVELSRANQVNDLPISIIVLAISILFFLSSIFYSRRSDDMEIPKWND